MISTIYQGSKLSTDGHKPKEQTLAKHKVKVSDFETWKADQVGKKYTQVQGVGYNAVEVEYEIYDESKLLPLAEYVPLLADVAEKFYLPFELKEADGRFILEYAIEDGECIEDYYDELEIDVAELQWAFRGKYPNIAAMTDGDWEDIVPVYAEYNKQSKAVEDELKRDGIIDNNYDLTTNGKIALWKEKLDKDDEDPDETGPLESKLDVVGIDKSTKRAKGRAALAGLLMTFAGAAGVAGCLGEPAHSDNNLHTGVLHDIDYYDGSSIELTLYQSEYCSGGEKEGFCETDVYTTYTVRDGVKLDGKDMDLWEVYDELSSKCDVDECMIEIETDGQGDATNIKYLGDTIIGFKAKTKFQRNIDTILLEATIIGFTLAVSCGLMNHDAKTRADLEDMVAERDARRRAKLKDNKEEKEEWASLPDWF
jgi:hypothetical protein